MNDNNNNDLKHNNEDNKNNNEVDNTLVIKDESQNKISDWYKSKENNKENESAKPNPIIDNIKSRYILSKIYNNMTIKKKFQII